jgi:tight adherence protein C
MYILMPISVFIATSLMFYLIFKHYSRKVSPDRKRLEELTSKVLKIEPIKGKDSDIVIAKNEINPKMAKLIDGIHKLAPKNKKNIKRKSSLLVQAGYPRETGYKIFTSVKIVIGVLTFLFFLYLATVLNYPVSKVFMASIMAGVAGYIVPDYILIVKSKNRQRQIGNALPDALDLLVITVEAGLSLNAAIQRVGEELNIRCKVLSQELLLVHQDLRTGISREQALRDLSIRNNIEDLKIFVGSLIIADKLGTSVARTLRAQSDSLRTRVRQRLEEKAAKASLKMLFPLVLFILPTLFIVLLGPGAIRLIDVLGPGIAK